MSLILIYLAAVRVHVWTGNVDFVLKEINGHEVVSSHMEVHLPWRQKRKEAEKSVICCLNTFSISDDSCDSKLIKYSLEIYAKACLGGIMFVEFATRLWAQQVLTTLRSPINLTVVWITG